MRIGQRIKFDCRYARKCTSRFNTDVGNTAKEPTPQNIGIEIGFIVGIRRVIMTDFKVRYGGGYGEDYEPPTVSGKQEWVLLVTKDIKKEPFIVRYKNVL